ncbi:MAG: LL-diaminopimelate aminotransferase [Deltaproteobacteria bacterium]|jgi:LL-diaminopimelate aminotransferase|nr:LL-diaminopimelate aminotransferase [Deltaproteobacteria bacterium]
MFTINENYLKLQSSYLFVEIAKRVKEYQTANPEKKIVRLGIGDVTKPLTSEVIKALHQSVDEMSQAETFKGYGPEIGYEFLQTAILENDYKKRGINLELDEIFISDGAKSDLGNISDILGQANRVAVTDPVYPAYVDVNVMGGRAGIYHDELQKNPQKGWSNIVYLPCVAENDFVPDLPKEKVQLIYLCYPNNPTGTVLTKTQLKVWVDYAIKNQALILFDSAYEAFITDKQIPHSIYEIEGAKEVAIEFRSFSKTAGFTGVRCGYTIVPKALLGYLSNGEKVILNKLWNRRQTTKFNGVAYIIQRAAEACYSELGQREIRANIEAYLNHAKIIREGLQGIGLTTYGGVNAPYVWVKTPQGISSWQFFDILLNNIQVVGTPGSGFGPSGEGYFRLTAFGSLENTKEAVARLKDLR